MRLTPLSKRIEKLAALEADWRENSKGRRRKRETGWKRTVESNIVDGGRVIPEKEI